MFLCAHVAPLPPPPPFQELTEEGIPFLILFHQKDDTESLEKFQQEVARQLIGEKGKDHR